MMVVPIGKSALIAQAVGARKGRNWRERDDFQHDVDRTDKQHDGTGDRAHNANCKDRVN